MRLLLGLAIVLFPAGCSPTPSPTPAPAVEEPAVPAPRELDRVWVGDETGDGPLLILMHGYGAPGDDLVPVAEALRAAVPELRVVLPEAPLERPGGGRAWWEIRLGARPADRGGDAPPGLAAARRDVIALIETLRRRGVLVPEATYLAGFSQGAMLAVDVALEWSDEVAGVAALSGAPVEERRWTERLSRRAPTRVFMSHGRQDPLLAFAAAERLRNRFQGAGSTVEFLPFEGGHTIPRSVVAALAAWLFPEGSQDTIEGEIVGRSPLGHGACVQQSYEVEPEDGPRVWLHFERCGNTSGPPLETLEDGKTYRFTVERGGSSNFADGPMIVAAEELP